MRSFPRDTAKKIMANEIGVEELLSRYPEYKEEVLKEIESIKKTNGANLIPAILEKYTASAKFANDKIAKSEFNEKTINAFLPQVIKARFALYLLEQLTKTASSGNQAKNRRFNLWDGTILQKILFKKGFERKPVSLSLFKFFWTFISNKKMLMPLLNDKGIYCFYSKELINELSSLIGNRKCLEIAAGDGALTKFLNEKGIECKATDDYSWAQYITYPDFVEKADAKRALQKYSPQAVLCSWAVPKNAYEKHVFNTDSVMIYIVIGTRNPQYTGNFELYNSVEDFTVELDEKLSSLIIPPSKENAVYIFRRKKTETIATAVLSNEY